MMLPRFQHREVHPKSGPERRRRVARGVLQLSAAQPHQEVAKRDRCRRRRTRHLPYQCTRHRCYQQPLDNGLARLLVPLLDGLPGAFEQRAKRCDAPTPVRAPGPCLGGNRGRHIAEQVPDREGLAPCVADAADHQSQGDWLARHTFVTDGAVTTALPPSGPVESHGGCRHVRHRRLPAIRHVAAAAPMPVRLQPTPDFRPRPFGVLPTPAAARIRSDQKVALVCLPCPRVSQRVCFAIAHVNDTRPQSQPVDGRHGGQHVIEPGFGAAGRLLARTVNVLRRSQFQFDWSNGIPIPAIDPQKRAQIVAVAVWGSVRFPVCRAGVRRRTQGRPIVHHHGPGRRVVRAPALGKCLEWLGQQRHSHSFVVQKTPSGRSGREGRGLGQRRARTGMPCTGGRNMRRHQDGVAILQSRLHRRCKESIRNILGRRQLV